MRNAREIAPPHPPRHARAASRACRVSEFGDYPAVRLARGLQGSP